MLSARFLISVWRFTGAESSPYEYTRMTSIQKSNTFQNKIIKFSLYNVQLPCDLSVSEEKQFSLTDPPLAITSTGPIEACGYTAHKLMCQKSVDQPATA